MTLPGWVRGQWYALVPAGTALVMGLWGLSTPGPWLDERFTIEAVTDGLSSHYWDAPMLPYYALMWLWSAGGAFVDEGWLRLLSVLAVVVGSVLVALTARRIASVPAGLAAGMLFVLSPGVARYAQEARTYALAACLVAAATWALVVATTGGRRRWWVGYAVFLGLAAVILPVSFAAIPAHAVVLAGFPGWRTHVRDWLAACLFLTPIALAAVLLGLWWPHLRDWLPALEWSDLLSGLTILGNSEYSAVGSAFALALVVLAAVSRTGLLWLAGCGAAVLTIWVISISFGSWWIPRSFVPLVGILAVAAGVSLAQASWTRIIVILGVLGLVSLPTYRENREPGSRGVDPTEIAAVLDENGRPGDGVLVPPEGSLVWWSVTHYLRGDPRFAAVTAPSGGRFWEGGAEPTCERYQEWRLAGDGRLRLCE